MKDFRSAGGALTVFLAAFILWSCTQKPEPVAPEPEPTPTPVMTPTPIATPTPTVNVPATRDAARKAVYSLVEGSECAKYRWLGQGVANRSYMRGMGLVFARAACNQQREDIAVASRARGLPESTHDLKDVLSWYNSNFRKAGISNDTEGFQNYRHTFALQIGLGMRESSGQYCCGRDLNRDYAEHYEAEAGLFQASYGVRVVSPTLTRMYERYTKDESGCLLDVFSENVTCKAGNEKNWGNGPGVAWQALTKRCPAFSAEYATVVMRNSGGTKGEFGPLRTKAAEINPACNDMLKTIQAYVETTPGACKFF